MDASTSSQEGTEKKHHAGSLPLYMFLTLAERNVHEKCANASNPYHKCTPACVQRMNGGTKRDASNPGNTGTVPLGLFVSPDGRKAHQKCRNASNPFHECTERCVERSNSGDGASTPSRLINENSPAINKRNTEALPLSMFNSSNPYHMQKPNGEKKGTKGGVSGLVNAPTPSRDIGANVHPKCPNAANPYHTTCTEACLQKIRILGKKQFEDKAPVRIISSKMEEKLENCKYALNPYHRCTETCIQKINGGKKKSEGGSSVAIGKTNKETNMKKETTNVNPKRLDASDAKNLSSSRNTQKNRSKEARSRLSPPMMPEVDKEEKITEKEKECNEIDSVEENYIVMEMLAKTCSSYEDAVNSSYKCAVDKSLIQEDQARGVILEEERKDIVHIDKYYVSDCQNASNIHNSCVGEAKIENDQYEEEEMWEIILSAKKNYLHSDCINAYKNQAEQEDEIKEVVYSAEKREDQTNHLYATNPFLICIEYCFRKFNKNDQGKGEDPTGLQAAAGNCLHKINIQTYFLLYLAITMSVLIAAGTK